MMPIFPFCTGQIRTCLGRCSLGLLVAYLGSIAFGQQISSQRTDSQRTDQVPHPWIATAPPAFARLIDLGQVQILIDDEQLEAAGKHGLTRFRFETDYRYQYQLVKNRPSPDDPSQAQTEIVARPHSVRFEVAHTVILESRFRPATPWEASLLQHEFDHVSISTDPRWIKIAKRVLEQPVRCTITWNRSDGLTKGEIDEAIQGEISARIAELERIVQTSYDSLDRETRDGQANLAERRRFFQELFSIPWLRKYEFAYLDLIPTRVQDSADNKEVLAHYLLVD
jgi:hypothetical protein